MLKAADKLLKAPSRSELYSTSFGAEHSRILIIPMLKAADKLLKAPSRSELYSTSFGAEHSRILILRLELVHFFMEEFWRVVQARGSAKGKLLLDVGKRW